ncbi:MAG: hypothetical protein WCF23_03905 [Candidatus Nitrosopolaris sp.]
MLATPTTTIANIIIMEEAIVMVITTLTTIATMLRLMTTIITNILYRMQWEIIIISTRCRIPIKHHFQEI